MGIRFYCPNGHKLNVKTEQAGKIGFCPDCGARVQIPLESTRPSSHKKHDENDDENVGAENDLLLTSKPSQDEDFPNETSPENGLPDGDFSTESPVPPTESADLPSARIGSVGSETAGGPSPAPPAAPASSMSILDNSEAVWYVRGSDNQTYGPISNVVLKDWIAQRRVGPTMLVWRDGWPSWLEAKNVFPEIETVFSGIAPDAGSVPPPPGPPEPPTPPAFDETAGDNFAALKNITREEKAKTDERHRAKLLKKKNKAVRDLILVAGLVIVIVILLTILIVILAGQKKSATEPASSKETAAWTDHQTPKEGTIPATAVPQTAPPSADPIPTTPVPPPTPDA